MLEAWKGLEAWQGLQAWDGLKAWTLIIQWNKSFGLARSTARWVGGLCVQRLMFFVGGEGVVGAGVYGGKIDFCWLYGPETTDSMDIELKRG